jgi:hypothetical protein
MELKIMLEQNGARRESTESEVTTYMNNPDYQVCLVEDQNGLRVYKVLERLME